MDLISAISTVVAVIRMAHGIRTPNPGFTPNPAFYCSPIQAQMSDVSQRETTLLRKLVYTLQSLSADLEKQSQSNVPVQVTDYLARYRQLCMDVRELLEAEQSLRGCLLSSLLDGPGDMRMHALEEHRRLLRHYPLQDQSAFDVVGEQSFGTATSAEETLHHPRPGTGGSSGEEQGLDAAKD